MGREKGRDLASYMPQPVVLRPLLETTQEPEAVVPAAGVTVNESGQLVKYDPEAQGYVPVPSQEVARLQAHHVPAVVPLTESPPDGHWLGGRFEWRVSFDADHPDLHDASSQLAARFVDKLALSGGSQHREPPVGNQRRGGPPGQQKSGKDSNRTSETGGRPASPAVVDLLDQEFGESVEYPNPKDAETAAKAEARKKQAIHIGKKVVAEVIILSGILGAGQALVHTGVANSGKIPVIGLVAKHLVDKNDPYAYNADPIHDLKLTAFGPYYAYKFIEKFTT